MSTLAPQVRPLSPQRFAALVGYVRQPIGALISREIAWLATADERLLAVVIQDNQDQDFFSLLLARDDQSRYRYFAHGDWQETEEAAYEQAWELLGSRWSEVPVTSGPPDIFQPIVDVAHLHPGFEGIRQGPHWQGARGLIHELMPHFVDVDGNFLEKCPVP